MKNISVWFHTTSQYMRKDRSEDIYKCEVNDMNLMGLSIQKWKKNAIFYVFYNKWSMTMVKDNEPL